jgi:hypothetical protein
MGRKTFSAAGNAPAPQRTPTRASCQRLTRRVQLPEDVFDHPTERVNCSAAVVLRAAFQGEGAVRIPTGDAPVDSTLFGNTLTLWSPPNASGFMLEQRSPLVRSPTKTLPLPPDRLRQGHWSPTQKGKTGWFGGIVKKGAPEGGD